MIAAPVQCDVDGVPNGSHSARVLLILRRHSGTLAQPSALCAGGLGWVGVGSGYTIKALDESSWDAFARLVEANNGVFGGCWCMGFHPDDSREPALNRERKLARVRAGTAHAALVFDGDDCLGWCQFGAPDEVPKIKNRAAYEKSLTTLPDWRIACNFVGKGHRRKGVATAALVGALESDRTSRRRQRRGLSRSRGFGSCRLPLQRRPVDLRKAGIRPRPQDRKAPLGRHQSRRANVVGDLATLGGHSGTLAQSRSRLRCRAPACAATGTINVQTTPLVSPPVALTIDVFARILAEIGRADDEDLEALWPGLVASPRGGRDAHRVPFLELDDLVVDFIRPLPRSTTYTSSCFMCVWPYGKR